MPHFTTYGGSHFSAGPDVYHPEFQPELNDFEIPHGPHFHGHDPVTGLDTGSGNDRFDVVGGPQGSQILTGDGLDTATSSGSPEDQLQLDTGSGNDRFMGLDTGSGNDRFMGLDTGSGNDRLIGIDTGSGNDHIVHHVGTTFAPGGSSYPTGVDHLGQFGHEADHFTNFAMPVGDFI